MVENIKWSRESYFLTELVEIFEHKFPLIVKVTGGYHGDSDHETMSRSEVCDLFNIICDRKISQTFMLCWYGIICCNMGTYLLIHVHYIKYVNYIFRCYGFTVGISTRGLWQRTLLGEDITAYLRYIPWILLQLKLKIVKVLFKPKLIYCVFFCNVAKLFFFVLLKAWD